MKATLIAAALATTVAGSADALSTSKFQGDEPFNAFCNQGASDRDCEFAVGELRGGNNAANGTWEVGVQRPGGGPDQPRQNVWSNASAAAFTFDYVAATGALSLMVDGGPTSVLALGAGGLDGAQSLFIRARSEDARNRVELTDMMLGGDPLDDLLYAGGGSQGASYLRVDGFDFAGDWTLTGDAIFSWEGSIPRNSRLDVNFKVTDVVAPIPVPAAGVLLLAALGGLGLARRRRA